MLQLQACRLAPLILNISCPEPRAAEAMDNWNPGTTKAKSKDPIQIDLVLKSYIPRHTVMVYLLITSVRIMSQNTVK